MANLNKSNKDIDYDQSNIHGGGLKVLRTNVYLVRLGEARQKKDPVTMFWCLERIWMEVEAWLLPMERAELVPVWNSINDMMNTFKGKPQNFMGKSLYMEMLLRRVLKRAKLDTGESEKQQYLTGGLA